MKRFLEDNPALSVINSLKICEGTITRERKTILGTERSVLDVFITCSKVFPLIKHMKIDHERKYGLSNFNSKKTVGKVTIPDHHPVLLTLDMTIPASKPNRTSHLNFRDSQGQMLFHDMPDDTSKLTEAISTVGTFKEQVTKWDKQVKSFIHSAFPKIRNRKRKFKDDEVGFLLEKKKKT